MNPNEEQKKAAELIPDDGYINNVPKKRKEIVEALQQAAENAARVVVDAVQEAYGFDDVFKESEPMVLLKAAHDAAAPLLNPKGE